MITKHDMMRKLGKRKFKEMVVHSQRGLTGAEREKLHRWGKAKSRMCEHGIWIIENYEYVGGCKRCVPESNGKLKDYEPNFNIGLGCWVESRSEEKRIAKSMGLVEAG